MKKEKIFLVWSMSRFDEQYSSAIFSLAKEISKTEMLIYVDYPFTWKDRLANTYSKAFQTRAFLSSLEKDQLIHQPELGANFYSFFSKYMLPINWLPKGKIYDFFAKINDYLFLKPQQKLLATLENKEVILINSFSPLYGLYYKNYFKPDTVIYQCRDWIADAPYIAKHGIEKERKWIIKADFCLATSSKINQYLKAINPNSYLLANAANNALFSAKIQHEIPRELAAISGEKLLYTGNIGARLDWELIEQTAIANPELQLLFIGPITFANNKIDSLKKLQNIHFLGGRKLEELAAYMQHCNYLWIPFQINNLTSAIYPLKLQEYFGLGKPVFCTAFSEDLKAFEKGIYFIDVQTNWDSLLENAKTEAKSKVQLRIDWAKENTWAHRKIKLMKLLETLI